MNKLNEIKEAIVLAAGRSRRMEQLSRKEPKCLLPYKGERVLERLVRQIKENGIEKIVITTGYRADRIESLFKDDECVVTVENKMYEEDVNILSLNLALEHVQGPVVIFEADTIMEDSLVKYVLGSDFEGKSVWFTRGVFNPSQYGGILKSDKYGNITDIKIVSSYSEKYKSYKKLSGLMRIGSDEFDLFKALVSKYAKTTIKQYYLNAWIENLKLLPCEEAGIEHFQFFTFNKPEEYYQVQNSDVDAKENAPNLEFVDINKLKGIEEYDNDRVEELKKEIIARKKWTVPIIVSRNGFLVLDGQHRMEVAKRMNLKIVPAVVVDYEDVDVWTLHKNIKITQRIVERKVLHEKEIFPYKTVKHKFGFDIPEVEVDLDELRK